MKILVTGSNGFVGRNLVENLKNIRDGKNRTRTVQVDEIYEYDKDTDPALLDEFCQKADFVFHLAGVNRPKETSEFMEGNYGFSSVLLDTLKKYDNKCPVMLASSIQASLTGRYENSEYGKSKRAGEDLFFQYGEETGAEVLVYRFPNLYGKWCKPNYNSVVATFCYNIAHGIPVKVDDQDAAVYLLYIDDLVDCLLDALEGNVKRCEFDGQFVHEDENGRYCDVSDRTSLVRVAVIAERLEYYKEHLHSSRLPFECNWTDFDYFDERLFATFLSYLPKEDVKYAYETNVDERGSFTELFKGMSLQGQASVNISKPGITKGQHWHNTKWEIFVVVSGHALIQERRIGLDDNGEPFPVWEFEVSGDKLEGVYMLPGYTHNIINLSDTDDLVTIMWASELFDPERPDSYYEPVV